VGTVHNIVRTQPETLNTSTEFVSATKPLSIYPAVYSHIVRILVPENIMQYEYMKDIRQSFVDMFCDKLVGPFFSKGTLFAKKSLLENFAYPLLKTRQLGVLFIDLMAYLTTGDLTFVLFKRYNWRAMDSRDVLHPDLHGHQT